ncbi:MAG TPA: hypothetical protein VJT82_11895 [Pyrinomonadaceae bacterium]|nr:hypothetical protein [Pyrinomonadaceae bacterium]
MFKRYFSLILIGILFSTTCGSTVLAQTTPDARADYAQKIKQKVSKRGTGERAGVTVKLQDGTKVKGYITEAAGDHFTVMQTDKKSAGTTMRIDYDEVRQLSGKGMSKTSKTLVGVGVGVAVTVGVLGLLFWKFSRDFKGIGSLGGSMPCGALCH